MTKFSFLGDFILSGYYIMSGSYYALNSKINNLQAEIDTYPTPSNIMTLNTVQTATANKTFSGTTTTITGATNATGLITATGGLTTGAGSVLTSTGTTTLTGATTATGLITATGGLTTGAGSVLTSTGTTTLTGATTATGLITADDIRINNTKIHLGTDAGLTTQSANSVAIGNEAGKTTQGGNSVAIGNEVGKTTQGDSTVAIGNQAGETTQANNSVAIGTLAGNSSQGLKSVAIGYQAGETSQSYDSIAIGSDAGKTNQGNNCIALGATAGQTNQGNNSIAIGVSSTGTGTSSVAIGNGASTSTFNSSVAIGASALCTASNQITLGTASETVRLLKDLIITDGTTTNTIDKTGYTTKNSVQNSTHYINFSDSSSTGVGPIQKSANLSVNPSTGTLTTSGLITATGGLTTGASSVLTSAGTTTLTGATTTGEKIETTLAGGANSVGYKLSSTQGETAGYNSGGLRIYPYLSAGAFNFLPLVGDAGIIWGNNATGTNAGFVIAPHSNTRAGIRINGDILEVYYITPVYLTPSFPVGSIGYTYTPGITWSLTAFTSIGTQSLPAGRYMGFVSISLSGTFTADNYIYPIGGIPQGNPAPSGGNDVRFPVIQNAGNFGVSIASGGYLIILSTTTSCGLGVSTANTQTLANYTWSITRIA